MHIQWLSGVLILLYLGRGTALRVSFVATGQWKILKCFCCLSVSCVTCRCWVRLMQHPFEQRHDGSKARKCHQHYPCTSPCAEINAKDCFFRVAVCSFRHGTQPQSSKITASSIDPRCILDQAMSPDWFSTYPFILQRQQSFPSVLSKWCQASISFLSYNYQSMFQSALKTKSDKQAFLDPFVMHSIFDALRTLIPSIPSFSGGSVDYFFTKLSTKSEKL